MKLYQAGIYTASFDIGGRLWLRLTENEQKQRLACRFHLESYHYIHSKAKVDRIRKDGKKVFLDSGAFSSYTKGVEVNMKKYCRYIEENLDIIEVVGEDVCASVLDSIGSAQGTYENQLAMERLGVRPLPCFHYGEDERYLEWYVANYDYITLGGMVPISTPQLLHWLDRIWDKYLVDDAGHAKVRIHGFGLTAVKLMERYPWYSVDSSSWVQIARVGGMMLMPEARVFNVSSESPMRKVSGQHIDSIPEVQRIAVERKLEACGVDLDRMRNTYLSRWAYNIWAFDQMCLARFDDDPVFNLDQQHLF